MGGGGLGVWGGGWDCWKVGRVDGGGGRDGGGKGGGGEEVEGGEEMGNREERKRE